MCLIKRCICWWKEFWCQNARYNNKNYKPCHHAKLWGYIWEILCSHDAFLL